MLARARSAFRKAYADISAQLSDNAPIPLHPASAKTGDAQ